MNAQNTPVEVDFLLYGHGGAYNHGAEALVHATIALLRGRYPGCRIGLSSHFPAQDKEFGIHADAFFPRASDWADIERAERCRGEHARRVYRQAIDSIRPGTVCLSVGGDNYCYDNWRRQAAIHYAALERGAKSVLWSASIEPDMLDNEMLAALSTHHLITVRDGVSRRALERAGLTNVRACADVAFLLEPDPTSLPEGMYPGNTVAINLSPLVLRREERPGMLLENVRRLILHILESTDMPVLLVPHVVVSVDNDCDALRMVKALFPGEARVIMADAALRAAQYKYLIARCRLGVFARTHATIAAYSSSVPAIALGYSTKATGIARDVGMEAYVIETNRIETEDALKNAFLLLMKNEAPLKAQLQHRMPAYRQAAAAPVDWL